VRKDGREGGAAESSVLVIRTGLGRGLDGGTWDW
jgi:hypothetical protein